MKEYSSDFVNNRRTELTRQVLPKLQSIIEYLSLNLSDLCNKISLCNIIDNSAAKKSKKKSRLYKEKENEFVMFMLRMLRRVNKMQPSQSNWNFPDFPPVPLSKPELLKLTIVMKIDLTLLDDKVASFHLDRKKVIFSHAYRGSSRSLHSVTTTWFQTTELNNP